MNRPLQRDADVHVNVTVDISRERAFEVYTRELDSWWPREHHIGKAPLKEAFMEPRLGGRLYEKGVDGSECDWGVVLAWEPPARLVFAWQINGEWTYEPDLALSSEVEVRFTALGPKQTRVELIHRHFERHGASAEAIRQGVSRGWPTVMDLFAAAAGGASSAPQASGRA